MQFIDQRDFHTMIGKLNDLVELVAKLEKQNERMRTKLMAIFPAGHEAWCGWFDGRKCSCHLDEILGGE